MSIVGTIRWGWGAGKKEFWVSVALLAAYSVSRATHVDWLITVRTMGEEGGLVVWLAGGL